MSCSHALPQSVFESVRLAWIPRFMHHLLAAAAVLASNMTLANLPLTAESKKNRSRTGCWRDLERSERTGSIDYNCLKSDAVVFNPTIDETPSLAPSERAPSIPWMRCMNNGG